MKYALKFAATLLAGMAACAVEPGTDATEDTSSSASSSELSIASAETPSAISASTQDVTCSSVWECDQICGVWVNGVLVTYGTNVLHRECDDGSDTVVLTHPCGEACF